MSIAHSTETNAMTGSTLAFFLLKYFVYSYHTYGLKTFKQFQAPFASIHNVSVSFAWDFSIFEYLFREQMRFAVVIRSPNAYRKTSYSVRLSSFGLHQIILSMQIHSANGS